MQVNQARVDVSVPGHPVALVAPVSYGAPSP